MNDGKTEKAGRRLDDSVCPHQSKRLGELRHNSQVIGLQQIGSAPADSSGQNTSRTNVIDTKPNTGKILERLKQLEHEFLSYLHTHQQTLEARLENSKEVEQRFYREIQQLEQEILGLSQYDNQVASDGELSAENQGTDNLLE
ncbi:MAG TPA: hypothetical protein VK184_22905 [Nostocaceae cyanobacterium]|nr:hypothetical protein [Nostocaceae cyanobacterium]